MPSPSVLPNFFSPLCSLHRCALSDTACKTKRKHTLEVIKNLFDLLGVDGCALLCVGLRRSGRAVIVVVDCDLNIPLGISEKCDGRLLPNGFVNKRCKKESDRAKGFNPSARCCHSFC